MGCRESDDDYDRVIAQLGAKHRVIACADEIQWIVQEKRGNRWRNAHFCTSRDGVLRWARGLPGGEALTALPERFQSGTARLQTVAAAAKSI